MLSRLVCIQELVIAWFSSPEYPYISLFLGLEASADFGNLFRLASHSFSLPTSQCWLSMDSLLEKKC